MAASDYARPGASVSEESAHGMWERSLDSSEKEAIGYMEDGEDIFPKRNW